MKEFVRDYGAGIVAFVAALALIHASHVAIESRVTANMNEQFALLRQDIQAVNDTLKQFETRFDRVETRLTRIETALDIPPN